MKNFILSLLAWIFGSSVFASRIATRQILILAWMATSRQGFYEQIGRSINYVLDPENRTRLGFVATHPAGQWLDKVLLPAYISYTTIYAKWEDLGQRTTNIISDMEDAEDAVKPLYSTLREMLDAAPYVTNSDLRLMGLPQKSTDERHPAPTATVFPIFAVSTKLLGHIELTLLTLDPENKARKRKPAGQQGAEIIVKISTTPLQKIEELEGGHSYFTTTTNLDINLEEHRGETVYFAGRWENRRGEKGPWSPIGSAIIP